MKVRLLPHLAALFATTAVAAPESGYDLVIRNARVLDGAGNPWVRADIAVQDGRIARIGSVPGRGGREIDAAGRYVAPGFIDMMDQSGKSLLESGAAVNKLRMGVTTLIAGEAGTPVEAAAIPSYFSQLERQGIAVNFGTYYASHQARVKVMGDRAGRPSSEQLAAMEQEVELAMRAGVFGITSALMYAPSSHQSTDDLVRLARVAARCAGLYATHMRDESAGLLQAVDEAIAIGERSGAKVEIFHLKAAYAPGWGRLLPQAIAAIQAARTRGIDIAADVYPYTAAGTGLDIIVPKWVWADGLEKGFERLGDPQVRATLKEELKSASGNALLAAAGNWENVVLARSYSRFAAYEGMNFAAIGKLLRRDPGDVVWDVILEARPRRALALYFVMSEADVQLALKQPWVSIGTDASVVVSANGVDALGLPHPRAHGTFPRVIVEYVERRGVLTLEEAIRKMTSWPAQRMGINDRGLLRPGFRADLVIFDLGKMQDRATWTAPTESPLGIDAVMVNGKEAIASAHPTGARNGMIIRHSCD